MSRGILAMALAACSYQPPLPGEITTDPDASTPDPDGSNTVADAPDPPADAPNTMVDCTGYAPMTGGFPAGAMYRGVSVPTPWSQARAACQIDGGDLVVIDNATEAAAVAQLAQDPNPASPFIWLGLTDNPNTASDNDFISIRGGSPPHLVWGSQQPTGGSQDCVLLDDQGPPHEYWDFGCGANHVYVCECLP